jgi:hypothetical protein
MADSGLTQCNLTAQNYGRRIGGHENWTPTLTENRNSQVHRDSDISSGREFGTSGEWWVSLFLVVKLSQVIRMCIIQCMS